MAGSGLRAVHGGRAGKTTGFEVGFVHEDDGEVRMPLSEAATVSFERVAPVRAFPSYKGQRNYPGLYYATCVDAHVAFESWLERDEAMAMDFDVEVVAFAAQPFWLFWADTDRARSHAPDFFARTAAGTGVVVDCRPADRIKSRDAAAFAATERACQEAGWEYRLVTGHDPVWLANVRWLAGYRHRRCRREHLVAPLLDVFAAPQPLMQGVELVGEPIAVLPTAYHLLWAGALRTELATRLEATSLVVIA